MFYSIYLLCRKITMHAVRGADYGLTWINFETFRHGVCATCMKVTALWRMRGRGRFPSQTNGLHALAIYSRHCRQQGLSSRSLYSSFLTRNTPSRVTISEAHCTKKIPIRRNAFQLLLPTLAGLPLSNYGLGLVMPNFRAERYMPGKTVGQPSRDALCIFFHPLRNLACLEDYCRTTPHSYRVAAL